MPHPLTVLEDLCRIIASEWIAVNTYIERYLNAIEWRLETDKHLTLETFGGFLDRLFIIRRRIAKYKALVEEQVESCGTSMPAIWGSSKHDHDAAIAAAEIKKDLAQIQKLIESNSKRVTESVDLITAIMSVREGETSIDQTRGLGFLTVIATIFLPFNTVTAILSMQTDFQPGKWRFWLLVAISAGICLCIWLAYIAYQLGARYHKRGNTRTMTSH
jgi:Mg2+ and Co2+ transporter CorA